MAYERQELSAAAAEEQREICARINAVLGPGERYALVDTYGCQQNESDSEILRGYLAAMGYSFTEEEERADVVVVNTCAVREHAQMRVFGNVGALSAQKREHPEKIVVLCGCMAQSPEIREKVKRSYRVVDLCFGTNELWRFPALFEKTLEVHGLPGNRGRVFEATDEALVAEGLPRQRDGKVKAWLSIMNGCNNFCSYCIVPYVRGRERSRRSEEIAAEAESLVLAGYKDITLLGQNVNSYGRGLEGELNFAGLLRKINAIDGDFRIRFMTSHPKDATEELFTAMAECEKVAPHLHLPLQSGSDRILKAMNRGYTAESYLKKTELARKLIPGLVLTTDIIVGFPGETEEDFLDTLRLTETVGYDSMFTFIYSPRPGTPAASWENGASREEIQNRFDRLLKSANAQAAAIHKAQEGKTLRVLIDATNKGEYTLSSRSAGGRLVHLRGDASLLGRWAQVKITGSNTFALFGEII
ncbi:MAG: tRNA (N6-isopentenyl adenosine(37)-C2)-methylthiotransferase MiaB [Oscillospiraceae bacterium]|nr:tRNA (N6-isopentenyl adenosine(37)-C2)-methylthiotransferase MiaB [Oscillospiraceae bacterium]